MRRNENVFSDDVNVGGPALLFERGGIIIRQRVKPDVRDKILVERQLNPPGKAFFRAGNAEIRNRFLEKFDNVFLAESGENEVRVVFEVFA